VRDNEYREHPQSGAQLSRPPPLQPQRQLRRPEDEMQHPPWRNGQIYCHIIRALELAHPTSETESASKKTRTQHRPSRMRLRRTSQ
jgi:hypothetical protein